MDKDIEHAEKALACIDKMKEGLSELVALLDIADDTLGEMERLETYKSINRTWGRWKASFRTRPPSSPQRFLRYPPPAAP